MGIIDKIRLNGVEYDIGGSGTITDFTVRNVFLSEDSVTTYLTETA